MVDRQSQRHRTGHPGLQGNHGTVRLLELDIKLHLSRCHGCHAGNDSRSDLRSHCGCLVGNPKGPMGLLDPRPTLEFSIRSRPASVELVLLTSIVWTALLSAWYPPVEEEE